MENNIDILKEDVIDNEILLQNSTIGTGTKVTMLNLRL